MLNSHRLKNTCNSIKSFAGRPRDMEDVKSVLLKNPEMDTRYIRQWLNELGEATGERFVDRFDAALKDIL